MTRVLICGIGVVDYLYRVPDMPNRPEKYRAETLDIVGGGCAANAAVAAARLGAEAALLTRLGDDPVGDVIASDLRAEGVDMSPTVITPGARSPMSSVIVDQTGERMIVNFPGADLAQTAPMPDLGQGVLADTRWPEAAAMVLNAARAAGIPAVLDAEAPVPRDLAEAASHVVFSAQGLTAFTGAMTPEEGLHQARADLPGWVAVTDGARGVAYMDNGAVTWIPGFTVDVKDTLGAGDVWHGAFTLALAEGQGEAAACRFAHAAAALKCTGFGGRRATPTRTELDAFLRSHP